MRLEPNGPSVIELDSGAESCSTVAQHQPLGSTGKVAALGATGSWYLDFQLLGGSLCAVLNFSSWASSQRRRRSASMDWRRVEAELMPGCWARQSAVNAPSTAAFST